MFWVACKVWREANQCNALQYSISRRKIEFINFHSYLVLNQYHIPELVQNCVGFVSDN